MKKISILLLFLFLSRISFSQEEKSESKWVPRDPQKFETTHSGTFNGQKITYKAVVGETFLKNSKGEVTGALWSTSYIREGFFQKARSLYLQRRSGFGEYLAACGILWSQSGENRFGRQDR